jgi:hypothetical protein
VKAAWHGSGVRWAPNTLLWWIAALFMVGSFCFAIASVPGFQSVVAPGVCGVIYFVGSIFFTSASYCQFVQSINTDRVIPAASFDLLAWQPERLDWWACAVQLVGTVWFNITTFNGMTTGLDTHQENLRVWSPDFIGSICFLVASWFAIRETCPDGWRATDRNTPWWIASVNMLGSIFFMASAFAAFVRPATGNLLDASLANSGTLAGALCFFWGARLLLLEPVSQ